MSNVRPLVQRMISANAALTFAFGLLLGSGLYPAIAFAQALASLVFPRGVWLHMLLTMGIWLLGILLYVWLLELGFQNSLPFSIRKANILALVVAFLVGVVAGGVVARPLNARLRPHE